METFNMDETYYITPAGTPMQFFEFTYAFISSLDDPLEYFFTKYDILLYLNYFKQQEIDIKTIKIMEEDNIRSLLMDPTDHDDIIQLGQMLREYYVEQVG